MYFEQLGQQTHLPTCVGSTSTNLAGFCTASSHNKSTKKRDGSAANQYLEATSVIIFATALGSQQIFLNFTTIQRKYQVINNIEFMSLEFAIKACFL